MLDQRVAIVTGSTSGIGQGIAEKLVAQGCHVVLNGFGNPEEIAALRERLAQDSGRRVLYSDADMRRPADIQKMVDWTIAELGVVDILVNNAGIQHTDPIEAFPPAKWDEILAVNLSAAFHTTRLVLPHMKQRGWGRVVNIASVHGLVASVNKCAYVAAKHGLVGFTKVVALETAGTGITCNAVCPGWVLTPLVQQQIDALAEREGLTQEEARRRLLAEKQPAGEFVRIDQVADLVVYLCSDAASAITGAALSIDGGWSAQ